jgi:hypothetical protein
MKKFALLVFCAFLPLLMAPSGGFPSHPKFAQVTVNTDAASDALIINRVSGTGNAALATQLSGAGKAVIGTAGNNGNLVGTSVTGDLVIRNTQRIIFSADGGGTAHASIEPNGQIFKNGQILYATARVLGSSGTLLGGNGAASAVRNSTGSYTVNWSQTVNGTCVCTIGNNNGVCSTPVTPGGSNIAVSTLGLNSGTFTLQDMNFSLICMASN